MGGAGGRGKVKHLLASVQTRLIPIPYRRGTGSKTNQVVGCKSLEVHRFPNKLTKLILVAKSWCPGPQTCQHLTGVNSKYIHLSKKRKLYLVLWPTVYQNSTCKNHFGAKNFNFRQNLLFYKSTCHTCFILKRSSNFWFVFYLSLNHETSWNHAVNNVIKYQ